MKRYYLIDHRILFLFGYLYYLLSPYFVGKYHLFEGFPGMSIYQDFYEHIPDHKIQIYAWVTFSWLIAFFLGHFAFKFIIPNKRSLELFPSTPVSRSASYISVLLWLVLIVFAYLGRNSFLGGYSSYDVAARGKISTLLVIFNFFLLYQLLTTQKPSLLLVTGTLVTALLLLSMGGRMYVIQTFLIILIYKTSFARRRWKVLQVSVFSSITFIIAGAFGVWRLGGSFGMQKGLYSFFAEPTFTWFSTSTFLISNKIPALSFPWHFLTSFLNVVPNTVISMKPYMVTVQDMGYSYKNLLGAESIWTSLVINFGTIGSFFFVFFTGFMLNLLRHLSEKSHFCAVYYILVCAMLPFQIFRDGFYIINKQLFFNFLLLPALILVILKAIMYVQQRNKYFLSSEH